MRKVVNTNLRDVKSPGATRPLKFSDIKFPTNIPTDIPDSSPQLINNNLKIATLISKGMYKNLEYECQLFDLAKLSTEEVFNEHLPNLLLIESHIFNKKKLVRIIQEFNYRNIPTVLWVTTPLDSFKHSHHILSLFRFIFTTDYRNIDTLKNKSHHENVFFLPFGVQPRLFNPIHTKEKRGFAAYLPCSLIFNKKFIPSQSEFVYNAANSYSADLITSKKNFKDLIILLKQYNVIIYDPLKNTNSKNVDILLYLLLACGINVITPYNEELFQTFGNHLLYTRNIRETHDQLNKLYQDPDIRDRLSLLAQRFIFDSNTYTHRINSILDKLGHHQLKQDKPGVSVICCTHMESYMNNIFDNFHHQTYDKKELIIVLNDPNMNKKVWEDKAKLFYNVRIIQPNTQNSVGYCTNLAVEHSVYDYIANFDHDDYYGYEYIRDNLNVFKYTDAGLIGKKTHYVYFEDGKILSLMLPDNDNRYVINIDGSSIFFKKEIFNKVCFIDDLFADIQFSLDCWNNDIKVYSCDKYNHVYIRRASKEHHAFKLDDANFMKYTYKIIENPDDFTLYVNV